MKIPIASVRRATERLRSQRKEVSILHLAIELNVQYSDLRAFLKSAPWLALELDVSQEIASGMKQASIPYTTAIRHLENAGVIVTALRIACLTSSEYQAVRAWVGRRGYFESGKVKTEMYHRRHKYRARAFWVLLDAKERGESISVLRLAQAVGMSRKNFYLLLNASPELRRMLYDLSKSDDAL